MSSLDPLFIESYSINLAETSWTFSSRISYSFILNHTGVMVSRVVFLRGKTIRNQGINQIVVGGGVTPVQHPVNLSFNGGGVDFIQLFKELFAQPKLDIFRVV